MSRISPGPLGVSCQPKKCDSYSLHCGSVTARSQDRMHLELTVLNVYMWQHSLCGVKLNRFLKLCYYFTVLQVRIFNNFFLTVNHIPILVHLKC